MSRVAYVIPTDMPGLFDVSAPEGVDLRDLTVGQVYNAAARYGWHLQPVEPVGQPKLLAPNPNPPGTLT